MKLNLQNIRGYFMTKLEVLIITDILISQNKGLIMFENLDTH
jgi:hypothetical protein